MQLFPISRQNSSRNERRSYFMSKKGENIYKRKDGRWEGRYIKSRTSTGKIIYGYVYSKTYRETKMKLKEKYFAFNDQSIEKKPQLFATLSEEWFENAKLHTKISTQNKYYNMLTLYILPQYGHQTFDSMTYESIESYCHFLLTAGGKKGQGLSTKTVSDILSIIRNITKFAQKKGISVGYDPSIIYVKQKSKQMQVLNKIEQTRLCEYILANPEPCNIGILVCLFTGLRIGEICALRWEDVSLQNQTIYIHQTLQRIQTPLDNKSKTQIIITTPKSACSIRIIPLPDEICKILIEYQKSSEGYLLTNDEYKFIEPRTMQNKFKKALKITNIMDTNFHTLRHTFATRCIELGFDVKSLSEILGHASVNITMNRYVHPTFEMKKENMEKLSNLLTVK